MTDPTDIVDGILDILEEEECTIAEAIAILEMTKYNLLRAGEGPDLQGITIQ